MSTDVNDHALGFLRFFSGIECHQTEISHSGNAHKQ